MRELETVSELRQALAAARGEGRSIGLVPTMGYLHAGHESLMRAAAQSCDLVVTTVFVNPLQFGAGEDLDTYPRDLERDRSLAAGSGTEILFVPTLEEMYPQQVLTAVSVAELADNLEGASRPTHFSGVATVVAKLFNLVGPCRAYFGEKDYQQLVVVRRMVTDLSFPVDVVACPTVREADGLALSSRNAYLDPGERAAAAGLYRALRSGAELIASGECEAEVVRAAMRRCIDAAPLLQLDYAEVVDPDSLLPLGDLSSHRGREVRLLLAARVGRPRLIDNLSAPVPVGT